ncbi:MAG: DUF5343 domain-containing protein [Stellaceae bacterium]
MRLRRMHRRRQSSNSSSVTGALPTPLNPDVLARAGISASLIPRTLQAVQALGLIDENGTPSATLEGVRLAPEAEYKQRIADWLRAAYADALQFVNPAMATESQIRDAFRNYNPIGQQDRMVMLFTGLFREAGLGPERQRTGSAKPAATRTTTRPKAPPGSRGSSAPPANGGIDDGKQLPTPIAGLLSSSPANGTGWSRTTRNSFIKTFEAVLDFCIPIVEEAANKGLAASGADAANSSNL